MESTLKKTLVLGLGNPILTDDGVGIHVIRALQSSLTPHVSRIPYASLHSGSTHDLSLSAALGREMGMALPGDEDIVIIAVEAGDVLTFGEACTPAVAAAIPRAVQAVVAELEE